MESQISSQTEKIANDLPNVLILGPPPTFKAFERPFSEKFRCLKPCESSISLHQFLSTHAGSVQAALVSPACPITADILQKLPELRFIMASSAGVDHIDLKECKRHGVKVANAGSIFSEDVTDMAVVGWEAGLSGWEALALMLQRGLIPWVAIISYTSRMRKPHVTFPFYPNIQELAAICEILVICCALTDETRHMVNKHVMLALGKEGIIVNIARGAIINEKELVECLVKGEIGGAGLDVSENEPNVPKELSGLDNVVMTPHCAMETEESLRNIYELVMRNLDAFFANKPLMFEVNK